MKKLLLSVLFLSLLGSAARADLTLNTTNPPGMPLDMSAGTTSGPMLVGVVSDSYPNDIMAAWQFVLTILPESGAGGTLTFQDPGTGMTTPPNPPNYVFGIGINALGISANNTNSGSTLSAYDFYTGPNLGAVVPGTPGANLLQMDFLASSNASGLFGIYAQQGIANTLWADSNFNTQYFTNVPNVTGMVQIGEVDVVSSAVPEPSTFWMFGLASAALAGWQCWSRRKQAPQSVARSATGP
jgi:hypothetical protein